MTQKQSSNDDDAPEVEGNEPEIEVKVEGDEPLKQDEETPKSEDPDVDALRKQLEDLKSAQERQKSQAVEADRRAKEAAAQLAELWKSSNQSHLDSITTALGAAQMEIDSAKKDIVLAGASQDYAALADAQERLAAAKAHMVNLEHGKDAYEAELKRQPQQQQQDPIESNNNLYAEEKNWLRQHPEAMTDPRKNAKLNAAYFDAMDRGLSRGSREYFEFIEEQMGYREKKPDNPPREDKITYAAPPSKSVPSGSGAGGSKKVYTLTKEEAEVARLSGITPQEYVKQKILLMEQKRIRPDDFPER